MSVLRRLTNLFCRSRIDRDIADELQSHIDLRIESNVAAGMSPKEARRDALLRFGNPTSTREHVAASDTTLGIASLGRDLRYAGRQLRRSPGFAITAIVILALGIGASTAIFSAVNPILFEPLPYPHGNRIATVSDNYQGQRIEATFGTYRELLARNRSFESLACFDPWQPVSTGGDKPERLEGQSTSANYFATLGIVPALGRDFVAADDVFQGPKVVILSDRYWRSRLNADVHAVGRSIKLDDDNYTVIGVMPGTFENVLDPAADVWTPSQYNPASLADMSSEAWGHHLRIAGRLRSGLAMDTARRELNQIAQNPQTEFPRPRWASLHSGLIVDSLQQDMVRSVKPALLAVMGAVMLLLAIACVNVTSLLLARGAMRQTEFAMRSALGAGKWRLIRQSITESLLLALLGGAVGFGIALAGVRLLVKLSPPDLPRLHAISLSGAVFGFALALSALVGIVSGLLPALESPRARVRTGTLNSRMISSRRHVTHRTLVVSEVALAVMLLVGAGLLSRSMLHLLSVDPGFSGSNLLTMQVQTSGHKFDDLGPTAGPGAAARRRFFDQALEEIRKVPGVTAAGFTSLLPLSDDPYWVAVYGSHFEHEAPQQGHNVYRYAVSPGFTEAMHIPLLRGRSLDEHDTAQAPHAALISASLARQEFPGGNALGQRLHVGPNDWPWFTAVGIVGDVRQSSLALDETDAVYIPEAQSWFADDTLSFVIRTRGDAATMASAVEQAIWRVDKDQAIVRIATVANLLDRSVAEQRFVLVLFEVFSFVALVLAATGIYGILSNGVAERTREIGVRAALGASRSDLITLVLRQGLILTAIGLTLGLAGAMLSSRALSALLFGTSNLDPLTYAAVFALLLCVSTIACLLPAWRAANIDPMEALRAE